MSAARATLLSLSLALCSLAQLACGADPAIECPKATDCQDCVEQSCVWVEWEDGATECVADRDEVPPADAAISERADQCGG